MMNKRYSVILKEVGIENDFHPFSFVKYFSWCIPWVLTLRGIFVTSTAFLKELF